MDRHYGYLGRFCAIFLPFAAARLNSQSADLAVIPVTQVDGGF
jgi:hypothetical protein